MELALCLVYYTLKDIAQNNSENAHNYNIAACITVGKTRFYGWNSYDTHPFARRELMCSSTGLPVVNYCYHAEVHALQKALRFTKKFKSACVLIARVLADGRFTMAKPCEHCQRKMKDIGINPSKITYTNWDGNFVSLEAYEY